MKVQFKFSKDFGGSKKGEEKAFNISFARRLERRKVGAVGNEIRKNTKLVESENAVLEAQIELEETQVEFEAMKTEHSEALKARTAELDKRDKEITARENKIDKQAQNLVKK